ncbi:hypothetical protein MWU65_13295 [Cellulophaga sp. F20128]|uniref:hypothetical protein n=1 Tax=Cellulophaga sp. F20128 TaxID=2926413 RepID=UPI001FF4DD0E|nr:hypothetical protein [Cellulophaga sp. F20128]MCK0158163.1 hypothetical protein [Cellulophaga sp. F20128]
METIKDIIENSAIGNASFIYQTMVLSIFVSIVITAITMLAILLKNASQLTVTFGY